jgi:hypothetical protein
MKPEMSHRGLAGGDKDAIVKYYLDKLLESYRNGQKAKPKVAKRSPSGIRES